MINNILLIVSNSLIILAFTIYLLNYLIHKNKNIFNKDGFDMAKDTISKYNQINIIETDNFISLYNIRRKVIKLCKRDYYGKNLSSISNSLLESGISVVTEKNKFIDLMKNIISNLRIFDLLGIIAILLNINTYTLGDAKITSIILLIIMTLEYFYYNIINEAYNWLFKNIKSKEKENILKYINTYIICNDIIFISELIILIRFFVIILKI